MLKAHKNVVIGDTQYRITVSEIRDLGVKRTFRGVEVVMRLKNGDFFAKRRFSSAENYSMIQNWMKEMHYSKFHTENMIHEFEQWDGVIYDENN